MSPRTGAAGPLSPERIVTAAIELADERGLDAVTMRRVAEKLGAGTMSLYRHVSDKEELVGLMAERVTGTFSYPDRADLDWRCCLHALARQDRAAFLAHPWMLGVTATITPPFGTASLAAMEWALSVLEEAGLAPTAAARAIMTINHYVQGSARIALSAAQGDVEGDPGGAWRSRLRDTDLTAFPRLDRFISEPVREDDQDWFADGLDVILDGLEIGARSPSGG